MAYSEMDPEDAEFLAEKQLISIIPTFNSDVIPLICGDVGPFRASLPVRVPLWLAVDLKKQHKCKILPPEWMNMETLAALKEAETQSSTFVKMPSEHYMIETKLLLGCASDDIPKADEIRTVVKDIWDKRMSKLRASIDVLVKGNQLYAKVDHLTLMEINSIRPILPHALDQLYQMKMKTPADRTQNTTVASSSTNTTL